MVLNGGDRSGWMDGWIDDAILRPFQQNLGHIRTMAG